MLVKAVIVFLLAMALLAMVGNLLLSGAAKRKLRPGTCRRCGRPLIGTSPCPCTPGKERGK